MRIRIAAVAALLAGASVGLASPASAEFLEGTYTADGIRPNGELSPMTDSPWVVISCGPGCLLTGSREFRLQGNTWTSSADPDGDGIVCTTTIDNSSLTGTSGCGFISLPMKLTKVS